MILLHPSDIQLSTLHLRNAWSLIVHAQYHSIYKVIYLGCQYIRNQHLIQHFLSISFEDVWVGGWRHKT